MTTPTTTLEHSDAVREYLGTNTNFNTLKGTQSAMRAWAKTAFGYQGKSDLYDDEDEMEFIWQKIIECVLKSYEDTSELDATQLHKHQAPCLVI